ncbi:hypothetical protein BCR42DRAFT_347943, partial [Absidia repens]
MLDIKIRVGTSLSELKTISPYEPCVVDGPHFKGTIDIRLKGLNAAQYFEQQPGTSFCIHLHGRFLTSTSTSADDIVFGNQFDQPLCLPRGFFLLTKFAQWWDPGLDLHLQEEQPYAYSPLIVTLNTLHITTTSSDAQQQKDVENDTGYTMQQCDPSAEISQPLLFQENTQLILPRYDTPLSSSKRQYYFSNLENRRQVSIESDQMWIGDFCNGYLDMMNGSIQIPGFSLDVLKYYQGQPLRFICKKRDDSVTYFIIEFSLSKCFNKEK